MFAVTGDVLLCRLFCLNETRAHLIDSRKSRSKIRRNLMVYLFLSDMLRRVDKDSSPFQSPTFQSRLLAEDKKAT